MTDWDHTELRVLFAGAALVALMLLLLIEELVGSLIDHWAYCS
jgi:hypothetical protein